MMPMILSGALAFVCLLIPSSAFAQCTWGGTPSAPTPTATVIRSVHGLLRTPSRIAVDAAGDVYATDSNAGTVVVRDPSGRVVSFKRGFASPFSIALDSTGNILIGELGTGSVTIFNPLWEQQVKLGSGDGEFLSPTDIAIDPDPLSRKVYVTDGGANIVKVYQPSGQFLFSFGGQGTDAGLFDFPSSVYVSAGAEVFVGDQKNDRVEIFDRAGTFLRCFARAGGMMGPSKVGTIQGITGDALGRIYLVDSFQGRVQVLDANGAPITWIGDFGDGPPGHLRTPVGLCIDPYNRLFVTSYNSSRIELFGLDAFSDPAQIPDDGAAPTVVMSSAASDSTNLSPIHVDVTFSKPIVGFDVTGISTANAMVANFTGAGAGYAFDLVPSGQGFVVADIVAGTGKDVNGNDNLPATFRRYYDTVAPTPVITGPGTPANTTRTLTIDFGEMVNGFALGMVSVSNGTAANLQPSGAASSYTVDVSGAGTVTVSVSIAGSVVTDNAGNANNPTAAPFTYPFDDAAPTPVITGATTLTNTTRTLTIAFGENVNGFSLPGGVSVTGGLASNLQPTGIPGTYTVDVLGSGTVTVSVSIPAGVATDDATNPNNAATAPFTFPFDGDAPTASFALDDPTPTGADVVHFSVGFNESVGTSFDASAVTVIGTLSGTPVVSGTDPNYTVTVTLSAPDGDGTVGISVGTEVKDLAGNPYLGGSSSMYTITHEAPVPVAGVVGLGALLSLVTIAGVRKMRKK